MALRLLSSAALLAYAAAASPISGFRPPAVPLLTNSPICNVWSASDALYDSQPSHWTGWNDEMVSIINVDGTPYVLMGTLDSNNASSVANAVQTGVTVFATQTVYTFLAGAMSVKLTFTSPLLTEDWDLLSRPVHYLSWDVAPTDGAVHNVQLYLDVSGRLVANAESTNMTWSRTGVTGPGIDTTVTALSIGAAVQAPLSSTNDRLSWGNVYLIAETDAAGAGAAMVLEYANITRGTFVANGGIPSSDNTAKPAPLVTYASMGPATGPQIGVDRSGEDLPGYPVTLPSADYNLCWGMCNQTAACAAWAYAVQGNGCLPNTPQCWLKGAVTPSSSNPCRVSGAQSTPVGPGVSMAAAVVFDLGAVNKAGASRFVAIAIDELLTIDWFGEACPPYWRRNMNDTTSVPMDMLAQGFGEYAAAKQACDAFDAKTATMLSSVGGDEYATIAQLVYRQVFGDMQLVWVPSKQTAWYFLKEVSSCGCLQTADVAYPAFAQVLYYAPELMKLILIPHMEYAMNNTNEVYPLPWAPHHLGYWPLANLPYTSQENMPLEETAWQLLQIASIAQRQGGDLTWLEPYWPVIQTWYQFLVTLLPFPGLQLSTDDFDGVLYNATNLAVKGVAAIAAYGYIVQQYTGNSTAAAEAYATAASYAETMVSYSWYNNGADSHFMIGYAGSQGDGGNTTSWPMLYNALWLRLLGFDNLLPNQDMYLNTMRDWYAANQLHKYGLPLNSRRTFTKDDWMTFMAATYYDNSSSPQPSAFSSTLFSGLFNFANMTTSRVPLSDWTDTDDLSSVGFANRPVYGAMWTPVLVAQATQLGLGVPTDAAVALAHETFARVHAASGWEPATQ